MAKVLNQHSYAAKVLKDKGLKLFVGGKQILTQEYPFVHEKIDTKVQLGENVFALVQKTSKDISYPELLQLGFDVFARSPTVLKSAGQRVEYYISRVDRLKKTAGRIPPNHAVVYDVRNGRLRINGGNASNEWVLLRRVRDAYNLSHSAEDTNYYVSEAQDIMSRLLPFNVKKSGEIKYIPEAIVGVSDTAKIVCVASSKTDTFVFGICGKKGSGKSIFLQCMADNIYYKFGASCLNLNDVNLETPSWCLMWKDSDKLFLNILKYINGTSVPLPMVYLSPSMREFKDVTLFYPEETSFKTSLPFKEVVLKYNQFFKGDKDLELGKSAKFMDEILFEDDGRLRVIKDENGTVKLPNLSEAKSLSDAKKIIEACLPVHRFGKGIRGSWNKIMGTLRWQWNLQYFDCSSGVESMWEIEFPNGSRKSYYPWNAILLSGLFGSVITSTLRDVKYHAPYVGFVTNSVFDMMKNDPIAKNKEVYLLCDEFSDMIKKDKDTSQLFEEVAREGRMNRIGFGWVTQHLKDVPESIRRTNTAYTFAFNMDASTANQVGKDHGLEAGDSRIKALTRLKKFQCIAFTKEDAGFVLYDLKTGERTVTSEPVKIVQTFPSFSRHMPPKEAVEENVYGEVA